MEHFELMWDSRLGQVGITKHRMKLTNVQEKSVQCAPYWVGPNAREIGTAKIHKMQEMKVIKQAKTEWAAPIVFPPKKDRSLIFSVDWWKPSAVTVIDSYPYYGSMRVSTHLGIRWYSPRLTPVVDFGKWRLRTLIEAKPYLPDITDFIGFLACHLDSEMLSEASTWQWTSFYDQSNGSLPGYILTPSSYFHEQQKNISNTFVL